VANVLGTLPIVPLWVVAVRITLSASRFSSGRILRATLTFGPAMWQCMSMPPGMTTSPVASSVLSARTAGSVGAATILPPAIHRSRTWPSTPFVGS
jgi:hypothetical protein